MSRKKSSVTSAHPRKARLIKLAPAKGPSQAVEAQAAYASAGKARVIDFLGITSRKEATNQNDESFFIELIRKGVPKKGIDRIMDKTGLTEDEMASILHISKRTIQRRNPQEQLNPEQSERLIEMAKLYSKGEEVLGSLSSFKEWMDKKVLALGDKKPKEFLDTSIGIGYLMDELGRIEHGIYS
jgi:putative toxin-antitoxin system antitoxin component (TIGR02293 family)